VAVGNDPNSVAIGELNNDGKLDVVVVNRSDDDISVLLGNGDGTFARTDVDVGNNPRSVAIGDLNPQL
ncbi:MAG: VCBS repeat-containing protein, partial [Nitrosopumilaceae archaeon]